MKDLIQIMLCGLFLMIMGLDMIVWKYTWKIAIKTHEWFLSCPLAAGIAGAICLGVGLGMLVLGVALVRAKRAVWG